MADVGVVDVVLPTNRSTPFLVEALDSVRRQTYPNWTLTVVDNGVPNRAELEDEVHQLPGARVVDAKPYTLAFARNVGASHGSGEFLVFHDDDDIWVNDRFEAQVDALRAAPDAPASWIGGWHMNARGERFGDAFEAVPATADQMLSGESRTPHICGTLMIRRSAYLAVGGFSPELPIMEDFEFMLRLLELGDFACVEKDMLGYRRHANNMTSADITNIRSRRFVMERSLQRLLSSARMRGDHRVARLLDQRLQRFHSGEASEAMVQAMRQIRRGNAVSALKEASWSTSRDPRAAWATLTARLRPSSSSSDNADNAG